MMIKYGSLNNLLDDGVKVKEIAVGVGVTMLSWTDRHPGTIIDVDPNGKWIKIQEDKAIRIDNNGMSDSQDYKYQINPNGSIKIYKKARNGTFTDNGRNDGCGLIIGIREKYFDYSF